MAKNTNNKRNNNYRRNQPTPSERAIQLIGIYQNQLCSGYSEETWSRATAILQEIGTMVDLTTYRSLGNLMSEAYTSPNLQNVIMECDKIAGSLQPRRMR